MLKTIKKSSNKKLGDCAATYRAGESNVFSTCPSTCPLKPSFMQGSSNIDTDYLNALLLAVPDQGVSWTYTHFSPYHIPLPEIDRTCINISTDSVSEAINSFELGYPTVIVRGSDKTEKVDREQGIRIVRCPAEYSDITCSTCGGDKPLCARHDRNYIIKFTAHGSNYKSVNARDIEHRDVRGGCYGTSGPVRLQWEKTRGPLDNDAETVLQFAASLPKGTKLRHHVVGDLG